jgi:hypothetical protein
MATDLTQVGTRLRLEPVQALLPIGANPAVERAARVLTLAPIRVFMEVTRQLADQAPALSWTEPRAGGLGDDAVTKQRDGFCGLAAHGPGPPKADGAIQSAPDRPAQGEVVLVPSAWPPLMRLQNAQTRPTCSPKRTCARRQTTINTSTAARAPVVFTMTAVPSRDTASAMQSMSMADERSRKRRNQVRAVVCGTPRCSAIGRRPRIAKNFEHHGLADRLDFVQPPSEYQVGQQRMAAIARRTPSSSNPDAFDQQRRS